MSDDPPEMGAQLSCGHVSTLDVTFPHTRAVTGLGQAGTQELLVTASFQESQAQEERVNVCV